MNYIFSREVQAVSVCAIVDTMDAWITHEQQGHRRLVSSWDQSRRLRHQRIRPPHQREGASQTTCTGQFFKLFLCAVDDIETKEGRRWQEWVLKGSLQIFTIFTTHSPLPVTIHSLTEQLQKNDRILELLVLNINMLNIWLFQRIMFLALIIHEFLSCFFSV